MTIEIRGSFGDIAGMQDPLTKQKFKEAYSNLETSTSLLNEAKVKLEMAKNSLKELCNPLRSGQGKSNIIS